MRIDCVCPPKSNGEPRHPNGDTVTFRPKLDLRGGLTARNAVLLLKQEDPDASVADILAAMSETYMYVGIESWTLTDGHGKPVPVTRATVRTFIEDHMSEALDLTNEADSLYSEAVVADLTKLASKSLPPTQTGESTSVNGSSPRPRKPSKPSLTSITPTDVTERISASPGGVYS